MTRGMKEAKRSARGGKEEEERRRENSRGKVIGSGTLAAQWHEGEESQEAREMVMQTMVMSEVMR